MKKNTNIFDRKYKMIFDDDIHDDYDTSILITIKMRDKNIELKKVKQVKNFFYYLYSTHSMVRL